LKRKNAKYTAAISLGVMGAGFAAAFPIAQLPYGFILQSGFEAGLVGGLADWFAVTALFRHPLGIPIPHTALLSKNRDKVTNAFVQAIQTNLLHKESIIEKMKAARIADKMVSKLKKELGGEAAPERVSSLLHGVIAAIPPETLAKVITPVLRDAIQSANAPALLEQLSRELLERGYEEPLFDYLLGQGERVAVSDDMRRRLGSMALKSIEQVQLGGFMGFAVNAFAGFMNEDKLGGLLQDFIISTLHDMRKPGNAYREAALEGMRNVIRGLPANERVLAEAERLKAHFADGEALEGAVAGLLRRALYAWAERLAEPSYCEQHIVPHLHRALEAFASNTAWLARVDEWIQHQAAALVEKNHGLIGKLVKENADKLDNDALIAMMEEQVGKDLQWIRVNGAVCGFAIGLVLGVVQWFAIHA
jgi:uncharacterized membrane-anchored protein YjiN (DUF445 family)